MAADPVTPVQVLCPEAPAPYCAALVAELSARLPEARFTDDPARLSVTLSLTHQSPTQVSGRLKVARPDQPDLTTEEATVMLIDGAPESLAPGQLAAVLAALARPILTQALSAPN